MLYLAIPAHNEVATIGVLLWRLRTVLAEFPREYEVVVFDDASTDETADVAEQYVRSMPVTVLRGKTSVGYAGAVDALVRYVSGHTRYPRRDAMLLLQGDFTDPPGIVPEFARRFESGADLVVGERSHVLDAPTSVRRLFTAAGWALRPFVRVDGVKDLTGSMRLVRVSVLRDALRTAGDDRLCDGDSWTTNVDLLLRLVPHARRVESVLVEPTYGVRMRESRRVAMRDALAALRWGWRARGRRAVPTSAPESSVEPSARPARGSPASPRRKEESAATTERPRERQRERVAPDRSARPRDGQERDTNGQSPRDRDVLEPVRRTEPARRDPMADPFAGTAGPARSRRGRGPAPKPGHSPDTSSAPPETVATNRAAPVPAAAGNSSQESEVRANLDSDGPADASATDASATDASATDASATDGAKARRNRRSRRRKNKSRDRSEQLSLDTQNDAPPGADDVSRADARDNDDDRVVTTSANERTADHDANANAEGDAETDANARGQRRGRRGRRGGARRARGRGGDRGGASSDGAADSAKGGSASSRPSES